MGTTQSSLFTDHLSDNRLVVETKLRNLGRDRVAFGVTQTSLKKGSYGVLENIFYGMNNLEIPLEMLSIENPAEILSEYFAAGSLKRENVHPNPNVPHNFFKLVDYINRYSYNNITFASLAHKFKKSSCFDSGPGEQRKRLEFLEQSVMDGFVNSFLAKYRPSNREYPFDSDAFYDPNCDGRSKGIYTNLIYDKLVSLGKEAKKL
jgi:hypothetical protein